MLLQLLLPLLVTLAKMLAGEMLLQLLLPSRDGSVLVARVQVLLVLLLVLLLVVVPAAISACCLVACLIIHSVYTVVSGQGCYPNPKSSVKGSPNPSMQDAGHFPAGLG